MAMTHRVQVGAIILICLYVLLLSIQINQPPMQRYPNWDYFWVDVRMGGRLIALEDALRDFEYPSINPYMEFGSNIAGEPTAVVSPLSLPNLAIFLFPLATAMAIRTIIILMLGGIGSYLFLHFLTNDKAASFFGALVFISIPFVFSMHYQDGINIVFLSIPSLLLLCHRFLECRSVKYYFYFVVLIISVVGMSDVHALIVLPTILGCYLPLIEWKYYRVGFLRSLRTAACSVAVVLLTSCFYIVPLYCNLKSLSSAMSSVRAAGVFSREDAITVRYFIDFIYREGFQSLYKPMEGSAMLLYVPICFYYAIVVAVSFRGVVFKGYERKVVVPIGLISVALMMYVVSVMFYSIPPRMSDVGRGLLRYQMNAIPFVVALAGTICFAAINVSGEDRGRFFWLIGMQSVVTDWLLFNVPYEGGGSGSMFAVNHAARGVSASNLVGVRWLADMWMVLPWVNLGFVVVFFVAGWMAGKERWWCRWLMSGCFVAGAMLLPLLSISVQNELRANQEGEWQIVTRNSYRWKTYEKCRECISGLIQRQDPNYRTLPVGKEIFSGSGRNWKLIGETELNIVEREKMLFSYRETMDPYVALLYSRHSPGQFRASNWMPAISGSVSKNMDGLRLMGVKWVVSADERIEDPDLVYMGECATDKAPEYAGTGADGVLYVYQVRNPMGIAFLADDYQIVNQRNALKRILQKQDAPWTRGVVYLEYDPSADGGSYKAGRGERASAGSADRAEIRRETFNSTEISVSSQRSGFLVLSYLYRNGWKAYVDDQELPIYRAYGGLMAIQVPAGQHRVAFKYTPVDVYVGLAITASAFLIPGVIIMVGSFRRLTLADLIALAQKRRYQTGLAALALLVVAIGAYGLFSTPSRDRLMKEARKLAEAGDCAGSMVRYRQAFSDEKTRADYAPLWLGSCYEGQEKWEPALETYQAWTRAQPLESMAWLKLARLRYRLGNYAESTSAFAKVQAMDALDVKGYETQGQALYRLGRYSEALEAFKRYLDLAPNDPGASRWLGLTYLQMGKNDEAITQLRIAAGQTKRFSRTEQALIQYGLASALCAQQQSQDCVIAFDQAVALDTDGSLLTEPAYQKFGRVLLKSGLGSVLSHFDFSRIVEEAGVKYVVTAAGRKVKVEGKADLAEGPRPGTKAVWIEGVAEPKTRLYIPPEAIRLSEGSFSIWAKLADPHKTYSDLLVAHAGTQPYSSETIELYIFHEANGGFRISYARKAPLTSSRTINDDKWHHYAFTWKEGRQTFYIDGKPVVTGNSPADKKTATNAAIGWIGYPQEREQWHGTVADLITFDRALEGAEVAALYRDGSSASASPKTPQASR